MYQPPLNPPQHPNTPFGGCHVGKSTLITTSLNATSLATIPAKGQKRGRSREDRASLTSLHGTCAPARLLVDWRSIFLSRVILSCVSLILRSALPDHASVKKEEVDERGKGEVGDACETFKGIFSNQIPTTQIFQSARSVQSQAANPTLLTLPSPVIPSMIRFKPPRSDSPASSIL